METIGVFEQVSVRKAVSVNAVPAIISMLVVLVYNVADTFFIGQTGDEMQVAAVSLATPVFLLFMAIGTLYGIGGTSVISRALGENRPEYARRVSSFCFWVSLFTGVLLIAVFYAGMDFILSWIGTSAQTESFARVYLECVAWSAPFVIVSNAFSNIVRAEGRSMEAMVGMIAGTVVNIVLDPIFILTLEQGIEGAAWATVIGNLVAAVYYWFILTGKVSRLSVAWRDFSGEMPGGEGGVCYRCAGCFELCFDECFQCCAECVFGCLWGYCCCRYGGGYEGLYGDGVVAARPGAGDTAFAGVLLRG